MRIDSADIEKARSVDIVALVQYATGQIPKRQAGRFVVCCPFHHETLPSFTLYPEQHSWYCFGCREGGDTITFVKKRHGIEFHRAVQLLLDTWPVTVIAPVSHPAVTFPRYINRELVAIWAWQLWHRPELVDYFRGRLFTDETIESEMWGYDGEGYFTVPVWDGKPGDSNVLAVRKRAQDDREPRYKGIANFNPSVLYNSHVLAGVEVAYWFFGEFDARLAWQDGFPAVSQTNGKDSWSDDWLPLLEGVRRLIVVPDAKGEGEYETAIAIAGRIGRQARVFRWPEGSVGKDYNEYRMKGGTAAQFADWVKPFAA